MKKLILLMSFCFSAQVFANQEADPAPVQVEGDFRQIIMIHSQMCLTEQADPAEVEDPESMTSLTPSNLVNFITSPSDYALTYREQLDEYFYFLNGGRDAVTQQASQTANYVGTTSEDERQQAVHEEVEKLLRWNSRNHMVTLQYEFCGNALALQAIIADVGCSNGATESLRFRRVHEFCADPLRY